MREPKPENETGVPQIEVTPEMIEAGADVLRESGVLYNDRVPLGDLMREIISVALVVSRRDHKKR